MTPNLHRLLSIQADLLDKYLDQNLGGRYAYCIMVAPIEEPTHVGAVSNLADRNLVEPVVRMFAARVCGAHPDQIIEVGPQQAVEAAGHG